MEKEAELTGFNVNEIMDGTLQFTKKSKAKFKELTEAAKGAETIPLTILSAAHSRMKNNMHHDSGKWEYASHDQSMKSFAMSQGTKEVDKLEADPKSPDKDQWKPFLVTDFDAEKQLMIMQVYDYNNIQQFIENITERQASKCLIARFPRSV